METIVKPRMLAKPLIVLLLAISPFISGGVAMDMTFLFSNGENSGSARGSDGAGPSEFRSGWGPSGSFDLTDPLTDRTSTLRPPVHVETVGPWAEIGGLENFDGWNPCCYGRWADMNPTETKDWGAGGIFDCTCLKNSRAGMYGLPVGDEPFKPWA